MKARIFVTTLSPSLPAGVNVLVLRISPLLSGVHGALLVFISLICPWWLVRVQRLKRRINGCGQEPPGLKRQIAANCDARVPVNAAAQSQWYELGRYGVEESGKTSHFALRAATHTIGRLVSYVAKIQGNAEWGEPRRWLSHTPRRSAPSDITSITPVINRPHLLLASCVSDGARF